MISIWAWRWRFLSKTIKIKYVDMLNDSQSKWSDSQWMIYSVKKNSIRMKLDAVSRKQHARKETAREWLRVILKRRKLWIFECRENKRNIKRKTKPKHIQIHTTQTKYKWIVFRCVNCVLFWFAVSPYCRGYAFFSCRSAEWILTTSIEISTIISWSLFSPSLSWIG